MLGVGLHEQIAVDAQRLGIKCAVKTGAAHVELSLDLGAIQIHFLEARPVVRAGSKEQIAADLERVGIQLPFEAGAAHVELSRDRRAVQIDILLEAAEVNSSTLSFEISPNITSDFVIINFSSPNFPSAQIKITDVFGRNLISEEIETGTPLQIPVSKFSPSGILFCELWKGGELIGVKKIIVQ